MADILQHLRDLDASYEWLHGVGKVDQAAKQVRNAEKDLAKLVKESSKVGRNIDFGLDRAKKFMGGTGKQMQALATFWIEQADAVFKAQREDWPAVDGDARALYAKLKDIEASEGVESPAFAQALKDAVASTEAYRDALRERESFARMVADRMSGMEAAYLDADEAATGLVDLLEQVIGSLKTFSYTNENTYRQMCGLRNDMSGRAKVVAKNYRSVADAAAVHALATKRELDQTEQALKRLYEMQGEKLLRGAKDFLSGLLKG